MSATVHPRSAKELFEGLFESAEAVFTEGLYDKIPHRLENANDETCGLVVTKLTPTPRGDRPAVREYRLSIPGKNIRTTLLSIKELKLDSWTPARISGVSPENELFSMDRSNDALLNARLTIGGSEDTAVADPSARISELDERARSIFEGVARLSLGHITALEKAASGEITIAESLHDLGFILPKITAS